MRKRFLAGPQHITLDDAWTIGRTAGKTFANINLELLERWSAAGRELAPLAGGLALLTSHPRSGTTLLEQVLDSHPDAISADELQIMPEMVYVPLGRKANSPDPVPQVLDRTPLDDLNLVRQAYWTSMEGALREPIAGRLLIDKNPELTMLLPLVARVFPEMKIVFALRDPRDVVISCFMQQLPLNPVSVHYLTLEGTANEVRQDDARMAKDSRHAAKSMDRNTLRGHGCRPGRPSAEGPRFSRACRGTSGYWNITAERRANTFTRRRMKRSPSLSTRVRSRGGGIMPTQLEPHMEILQPFMEDFGYA